MKRTLFFVIWFVLLALGTFVVVKNPIFYYAFRSRAYLADFALRISLIWAFTNLFIYLTMKFRFAKILSYLFIFLSLISILATRYLGGEGLDPFYAFTQICALCSKPAEYYITFGRISFWLAAIVIIWKKFKDLNYLIFLLIGIEAYFTVAEFHYQPFFAFVIIAYLIVLYIIFFKKLPELYRNFRSWLAD